MEVVVDGTVDSCLQRVDSFFRHEWPHGGQFTRYRSPLNDGPEWTELTAEKRYLYNSWGGLALIAGLSLITFGTFLVLYMVYLIVVLFLEDMAELIKTTYTAQVVATPEGPGRTQIQVSASRRDWQQTLDSWVQEELVANGAAAVDPAEIEAVQEAQGTQVTGSPPQSQTDIPEQIRKLGELRDAGVLSEDEFEAKKKELLDRL